MKINTQSNSYTIIYASILVIVVATILAVLAQLLKPIQDKNVEVEKKMNILASVRLTEGISEADDKTKFIESAYERYITESYVINTKGEIQEGVDAFTVDLKKELDKPESERNLPVFKAEIGGGQQKLIIPLRGKGLWGPIWGYISLDADYNTIYGVTFDHKSETPGLGAEISLEWFQDPFAGKKIFEGDKFVSIDVVKGGAPDGSEHGVDGVSGGTITSDGLEDMIRDILGSYVNYFKSKRNEL